MSASDNDHRRLVFWPLDDSAPPEFVREGELGLTSEDLEALAATIPRQPQNGKPKGAYWEGWSDALDAVAQKMMPTPREVAKRQPGRCTECGDTGEVKRVAPLLDERRYEPCKECDPGEI